MRRTRTFLPAAFAALILAAPSTIAADSAGASQSARLSEAERAAVERVESYLSGVDTLHSEFLQTSSNGATARGEVWIDRPGKLRFEYDPPHPALLVSNGTLLLYWDRELEQTSYVPISETPLWFLIKQSVNISGADGYEVAGVEQDKATLRIAVVQEGGRVGEPGSLVLTLEDRPLRLKKWRIVDQQGLTTEVALIDPRYGVEIDPDRFDFGALDLPDDRGQPGGGPDR